MQTNLTLLERGFKLNRSILTAVTISLIILVLPAYAQGSLTRRDREEFFRKDWESEDNVPNLENGRAPQNLSRSFNLHVVFVGYDPDVVDTALVDSNINRYYGLQYWDAYLQCNFEIDYTFASESYLNDLRNFILQHSVTGTGETSTINATALQYQKETGTPMSIFLPQSGMAIDAFAVEQWFADNPYNCAYDIEQAYTFYILNFTEFDSPDHSWEHWYNITRLDLEAKSINDYWRLEWDNPLNPDVKFPYPAFTSRHRLLFIDPSAFQWYLTWARIWWGLDNYLVGPKYAYYYQDLDSFLASNDVSTPGGRNILAEYLAGWIDDFLYNLISPVAWPQTGNTLSLQILVLNNVSQYGYPNEKMKWILNSTLIEEPIKNLAPYMDVDVSIIYENLSSYPEIEEKLSNNLIEEEKGWRYYDAYQLFFDLLSIRDQHFNMKAADITVNGYVLLLKNASLKMPSGVGTGLGGLQQVLLLKSIDRYFRFDGVTPKSGLGMMMIHELGHNIAFPHTFGFLQYAGDFSDDVMGYFSYSYSFCRMRTDMFRRTVVDMKLLELKKALKTDVSSRWPWPRKTLFLKNYLLNAIKLKIDLAMQMYDEMDYLSSYYNIIEAERLETYLREITNGIRVPGDIDSDSKCHLEDICAMRKAYGSTPSSPNWNPNADLNKDGIINSEDCHILKCFFGQKAKVTVGFFGWKTEARSTTIDVGAIIFPEWDMPYTELNITYGLQNWGVKTRSCLMRISEITLRHLIKSVNVTIYTQTTTVAEITWTSATAPPTDWVKLTLDPSTQYTIMIEVQGTAAAFYEMTVITLECQQIPPCMPPIEKSQTQETTIRFTFD